MSSLKRVQIGDFIDVLTDYHSNGSYKTLKDNVTLLPVKDYAIMIRTLNFERNDFSDDLIYVDKSAYEHLVKSKVYPNDILTNKIANPGSIYIMPDLHYPVTCGMNLFLIRFSPTVNQRYMYYCMKNSEEYIKSFAHGTTTKTITKEEVRSIDLLIHTDINEQNKIEHLLSSIDRKIEINQHINDNLQHQLKLMYDYWFTQFDFPDENGKPYRASGGAMVWNEQLKRKIPVNWKAEMLSDVFEVTMGSSPTGDSLNDNNNGIEFYQGSTDFGSLYPTERIYTTAPIRYAKQQDVLLSVRAPVGALNIAMNNCCIGRGLAAIHHESTAYAWCTLKALQPFFDIFNANGTTFGALTSDDLKNHYIISPDNDVLQAFIRISKPIEEKMRVISKEIRQLSTLRDWLLPMLMNGQATISD